MASDKDMIFGRIEASIGFDEFNSQVSRQVKTWLLSQAWDLYTNGDRDNTIYTIHGQAQVSKLRFCHILHELRLDVEAAALLHQEVRQLRRQIVKRELLDAEIKQKYEEEKEKNQALGVVTTTRRKQGHWRNRNNDSRRDDPTLEVLNQVLASCLG